MNDCLYLILNTVSTNAVWGGNALLCEKWFRHSDRGRKAAELGCGGMPRASYAPSG